MAFNPNDKTKKFVRQAKSLVEGGKVSSYVDLADNIDWDRTALSNVINGRRNIPPEVYLRFTNLYKPAEIKDEGVIYEIALQNQAMIRVVMRAVAEVLSKQRNEAITKTLGDLEAAVRGETQLVRERLSH